MIAALTNTADRNIIRYAMGSAVALLIAVTGSGPMSFALPVLMLPFLGSSKGAPTLKEAISFIGLITISVLSATMFSYAFVSYPIALLLALTLAIFFIFYASAPFTPVVKTWFLIAILIIPNIAIKSVALSEMIGFNLVQLAIQSIVLVWLLFMVFPHKKDPFQNIDNDATVTPKYQGDSFNVAITRTLVILPVLVMFYLFELTSSMLILIFIAMLSMQAGFGKGFTAGKPLIIGNLVGGLIAIVAYELFTIVPLLAFLFVFAAFIGLLCAKQFFGSSKIAPLFNMAFSTFLLIIGSTTGGGSTDADAKVWTRVVQIMAAVTYVAIAFGIIDKWKEVGNEE